MTTLGSGPYGDLDRILTLVQQTAQYGPIRAQRRTQEDAARDACRVLWQHEQRSEVGLAPGQWCPQCGEDVPCPDEQRARITLAAVEAWAREHGAVEPSAKARS